MASVAVAYFARDPSSGSIYKDRPKMATTKVSFQALDRSRDKVQSGDEPRVWWKSSTIFTSCQASQGSRPQESRSSLSVRGLQAAIECDMKGHSVILLEKVSELKPLGDIISFSSNSGKIFERWENLVETLEPICHHSDGIDFFDWEGHFITRQTWDIEARWGRRINGHRGEIHQVVYEHARQRGIDIRSARTSPIILRLKPWPVSRVNGEQLVADCVFAAEGVKSRGRKIVLGFEDRPKPSGYAVYRTWFDSDELAKNERTKHLVINRDSHTGWVSEWKRVREHYRPHFLWLPHSSHGEPRSAG